MRLKEYDYSRQGAYLVAICTHNRKCVLAQVIDNGIRLNDWGKVVEAEWLQTVILRPYVTLDAYVVMPNHFHAILFLERQERATQRVAPTEKGRPFGPMPKSVGAIVGQFKSQVTKRISALWGPEKEPIWQRNYYEHVIRDEDDLNRI